MAAGFHPLTVAEVRPETANAVSVLFTVPPELSALYLNYVQGQHLTLRHTLNGQELRRNYSICASVADRQLRIIVKHVPGGRFSEFVCRELRPGMTLDVMPPSGRFFTALEPTARRHYLAIAAGSGITPVFSIIKTILETESGSRCTLVYGNRRVADIIFLEALEDLKNRYRERFNLIHVLSREQPDVELQRGRIDAAKIRYLLDTLIPTERLDQCFVCGPQAMTDAVSAALQQRGIDSAQIHFELFTVPGQTHASIVLEPARQAASDSAAQSEIAIILDGRRSELTLSRHGSSILDAALRSRPELPYACKGGVCSTCRAKVIEGEVTMAVCYGLEPDEIKAGYVLTCQARPVSQRVVLDYDAR